MGRFGAVVYRDIYFSFWLVLSSGIFSLDGLLVSLLESPSIYSLPASSFFVFLLIDDVETDSGQETELLVANGGSLNRWDVLKLCAYGNIDFDFIFSFWLRILIELQGSHDYHRLTPIKSQTQFPEVSTQSILPSFNEKRKVTNFIYKSGY